MKKLEKLVKDWLTEEIELNYMEDIDFGLTEPTEYIPRWRYYARQIGYAAAVVGSAALLALCVDYVMKK